MLKFSYLLACLVILFSIMKFCVFQSDFECKNSQRSKDERIFQKMMICQHRQRSITVWFQSYLFCELPVPCSQTCFQFTPIWLRLSFAISFIIIRHLILLKKRPFTSYGIFNPHNNNLFFFLKNLSLFAETTSFYGCIEKKLRTVGHYNDSHFIFHIFFCLLSYFLKITLICIFFQIQNRTW